MIGAREASGIVTLAWRGLRRRPTRTGLVIAGIAVAIFLVCTVDAMSSGVKRATRAAAGETALVVYRQNRFCPFTSQLPQSYEQDIRNIPGVSTVTPVKIVVSNCRASLDVVTFRGVPAEDFARDHATETSPEAMKAWLSRSDAALLGPELAARRRLVGGDRFTAAGVDAFVAGVIESDTPQDQSSAFVHLSFLQEQLKRGGTGTVVTQFDVRVTDPARLEEVATAIDAHFAADQSPTTTRAETAHVARAATDVIALVGFAELLGLAGLAAVFALVANAIVLSMRSREREVSILQTLGFTRLHLALLVVTEAVLLGGIGGVIGALASYFTIAFVRTAMTMEGVSIAVPPSAFIAVLGVGLAMALSLAAGIVPAIIASRQSIVAGFRS
ncbi:MAG: ABC transporter permease [Phycisphaerales bacterium]|nr:ABC transporter permease [Phycisphaerales bacterium]